MERDGCADWETEAHVEAERVFQEQYLCKLWGMLHFVRLFGKNSWTFKLQVLGADILCATRPPRPTLVPGTGALATLRVPHCSQKSVCKAFPSPGVECKNGVLVHTNLADT